jgi:hypothetical protein
LVSSGLTNPYSVAVDGAGNIYIADRGSSAIKEWSAGTYSMTSLVSNGLTYPDGVAVDLVGNVYIADTDDSAIKEWSAASHTVSTLVSSMLYYPDGVAVDGAGNVYIADTGDSAIDEWTTASQTAATLVSSGLGQPNGVAVDGLGNIYIADRSNNAIEELPRVFVDPTAKLETASPGNDGLPQVLPAGQNLTGPFTPTSDSPWLTINGISNGVVTFAFTTNDTSSSRTAHIFLFGQTIAVSQAGYVFPPLLTGSKILSNASFQFEFTNAPAASFSVWTTTNVALPYSNWTILGPPSGNGSGLFQFTDPTTNRSQRFYRVTAP